MSTKDPKNPIVYTVFTTSRYGQSRFTFMPSSSVSLSPKELTQWGSSHLMKALAFAVL